MAAPPPKDSGFYLATDAAAPQSTDTRTPFRDLIPSPDHPRIAGIENHTPLSWCESRRQIEAPAWLINRLDRKNVEPFKGFTADGKPKPELYEYKEDEGAPVEEMVKAAEAVLKVLSEEELREVQKGDLRSDEFRIWSNPELYINPGGLRLDETSSAAQDAIHALLRASSSKQGYEKILGCCLTNEFLGQLVNGRKVLNKHSYNFRLFGTPSATEPWGYTFFGHHLCIAVTVVGKRLVMAPTFFAAEPDYIDEGPHEGLRLFENEEHDGLELIRSLEEGVRKQAIVSESLTEISTWNPFDERHVGGAQQDNRVVPYEGAYVKDFTAEQKATVMRIFAAFHENLPEKVLEARLMHIEKYLDETRFMWLGKYGPVDAFYYRLHSPVAFVEFDNHCGIFLSNTFPSRCHVHTTCRYPNGADYGMTLLSQSEAEKKN